MTRGFRDGKIKYIEILLKKPRLYSGTAILFVVLFLNWAKIWVLSTELRDSYPHHILNWSSCPVCGSD